MTRIAEEHFISMEVAMHPLLRKLRRRSRAVPPMLEQIEPRTLLSAALAAAPLPVVSVVASRAASEINATNGILTFSRTGKLTDPLTVGYAVSGTAASGVDFAALAGTVTFESGKRTARVNVAPLADALAEGNENVVVTVSAAADYDISRRSTARINIRDAAPTVSISTTRNAFEAGLVNGRFRITRTGSILDPLTVTYVTTGTALVGTRFVTLPGTITIPAGQRSAFIDVTPIADNLSDPRENVIVTLNPSADFNLNSNIRLQSAAVNIMDARPLQISAFAPPAVSTFANSFAPTVPNNFASATLPSFSPGLGSSFALIPPVSTFNGFEPIGIPGITPLPTTTFTPVSVILPAPQTISVAGSTLTFNTTGMTTFIQ
jgi:hypothetical protein